MQPEDVVAAADLVLLTVPDDALGGLTAGYLIFVLRELVKTIPARDARVAGATLAAALALIAAALYLERCCRAPKPPDDSDEDEQRQRDTWQWHA